MSDVHDPGTRSYNMSKIKGKDTTPEMKVRRFLHAKGFRFRLHDPKLPGRPDMILKKYNTVIFVHGCFWHGHEGCRYFVIPKTRTEWWLKKILRTKERDKENVFMLEKENWKVIEVWECELRGEKLSKTLNNLMAELHESTK